MDKAHILDEPVYNAKGIATVRIAFQVPSPKDWPADATLGSQVDIENLDEGDLDAIRAGTMIEKVRTMRLNERWSEAEREAAIKKQYGHEKAVAADLTVPAEIKGTAVDCTGVAAELIVITPVEKEEE